MKEEKLLTVIWRGFFQQLSMRNFKNKIDTHVKQGGNKLF